MGQRRIALLALALLAGLAFTPSRGAADSKAEPASAGSAAPAAAFLAPLSQGERLELPVLDGRVPRPDEFLGYPLGSRFTHWERILDYLTALDATSDRVQLAEYGRTVEGRRLALLAISTPGNLGRLDEIRREHQRLADPDRLDKGERERLAERLPAVVWLGYGVHGNEASSAEAAMGAAYVLAASEGDFAHLLDRTIFLIDPLMNPDGRERYVAGYEQRRGGAANSRRDAAEHAEPWPGGRQNHYLLDLNRDWAWASQPETRARLAAYRAWEPQVFVDFHEMGTESTYFFPPTAEPVHPRIPRRTLAWLESFGRANASSFDRLGWVYFKAENYDFFYPGYGDTYPSLRGAVGMTYEMAGGGHAGEVIVRPDGTPLTLADRVAHHLATTLATARTAGASSRRLLADFVANRLDAAAGPGRTYLWSADQPEARSLADLLALHGVRVEQLPAPAEIKVHAPAGSPAPAPAGGPAAGATGAAAGDDAPRKFPAGSFVVSSAQPLGPLVEALLERKTQLPDRFIERQKERLEQNLDGEFYDVTAWSLPLALNLVVWNAASPPAPLRPLAPAVTGLSGEGNLGVLVPPQGIASYRFAAKLRAQGIVQRVALRDFRTSTESGAAAFPAGTIFVPRYGNPADLDARLGAVLDETGLRAARIASSYDLDGLSLGSSDMPSVRPVRIGLLGGSGVDVTSFGALWFLLDRDVEAPVDRLEIERLGDVDLAAYDVLVLPDGRYGERLSDKMKERIDVWIKGGGELVAIAGAISWLQDKEMTAVKKWEAPAEDPESPDDPANAKTAAAASATAEAAAKRPIVTPGAAFATHVRSGHPLAIGIASPPPVLVDGDLVLQATGDPQQDVLTVATESPLLAGFAFPEAEQRLAGSLLASVESRGQGAVVLFAQEPAYRLFWRGTMPLFLNAVLFGPSLGMGGR